MATLQRLRLKGWKSIRDAEVSFGTMNILIGMNGAGKSNLLQFFKMLNFMATGALQEFVGRHGRADSLLYMGSRTTPRMNADLEFQSDAGLNTYRIALSDAAPDTLIFTDESALFARAGYKRPIEVPIGAGHSEAKIFQSQGPTEIILSGLLRRCRAFQFHDTSEFANVRKKAALNANGYLFHDAGNLAAYLYRLKLREPAYYKRIVSLFASVCPNFRSFELEPDALSPDHILLNWRMQGSDYLLGPHQFSDGSLRALSLITLLYGPPELLPKVLLIDEPELGLHPRAIEVVASLLKSASESTQVIVATQSTALLDHFSVSDIITAQTQRDKGTFFSRHEPEALASWLEEYSVGELWEKNVLSGGFPS